MFSLRSFLDDLVTGPREPVSKLGKTLETHVAAKRAPDLRAFCKTYGASTLKSDVGQWQIWVEPALGAKDDVATFAAKVFVDPFAIVSACTDTVVLGSDGGGQIYVAEIAETSSEVFLYAGAVGELKFLADSVTTFAELNDLDERWQALCERTGGNRRALVAGTFPASPELAALREATRTLVGRVNLPGFVGSDAASEFDATVPALAGRPLLSAPKSSVLARYQRAYGLLALLSYGNADLFVHLAQSPIAPPQGDEERASTWVLRLWTSFLLDDAGVAPFVAAQAHPAGLVRQTARLLDTLRRDGALPPALQRLRTLRDAVRAER